MAETVGPDGLAAIHQALRPLNGEACTALKSAASIVLLIELVDGRLPNHHVADYA